MTPEVGALAVKSATGWWTATGIWTGLISAGALVVIAVIKQWGPWKRMASDDRASDFARLRDEIGSQNVRIEKLEALVEKANEAARLANAHSMRSDAKLETALAACEVLLSLVEREMPQASEIGLVKRLLAQAASDDMGIGAAMRKLSMVRGVGE